MAGDEATEVETADSSAATYAVAAVPRAAPDETVAEIRQSLHGGEFESAQDVVVLAGDRAVGLASMEALLEADPQRPVRELMAVDPPAVSVDTDSERAAHMMVRHRSRSLVVTDANGSFTGLIPAERMLGVLLAEHDSDLARLGGYLAGTSRARGAAQEPVRRRLWHRLPWLLLGVLGAMGSAILVGAFDAQLEENVIVAFFVPAIVYMADAVGTQTETVLIRALAAGVSTVTIVRREIVTGLVMGGVVGLAFFAFVALGWGDVAVATAVALALLASCSIATLVAMILPTVFQRLGRDPAFGSGPLATVTQDLLSIAVYFVIVAVIL